MKDKKVVVIGSGLTGISAAVYLRIAGYDVEIYEGDSEIGGLAGNVKLSDGTEVPKFCTHWSEKDKDLLELFSVLNLSDQVIQISKLQDVFFANDIFKYPRMFDILKFPGLSICSRLRSIYALGKLRRLKNWIAVENITAMDWLLENVGQDALDKIWSPQLHGRYGSGAHKVSAVWLWNRLQPRTKNSSNRDSDNMYGFSGGSSQIVKRLNECLKLLGVTVHLNSPVEKIKLFSSKVEGVVVGGNLVKCDHVLSTIAPPLFCRLTSELSNEQISSLQQVEYIGNRCFIMRLGAKLQNLFYRRINDPKFPFVGVVEYDSSYGPEVAANESLTYMSRYLPKEDSLFRCSDEEYTRYCLVHFKKMFPGFDKNLIRAIACWKYEYSQPIGVVNYSNLIPGFKIGECSVWCSTMAHIYPESRTKNNAVRYGRLVAEKIIASDE